MGWDGWDGMGWVGWDGWVKKSYVVVHKYTWLTLGRVLKSGLLWFHWFRVVIPGETKQKRVKRIRRYSAVFLFFIVTNVSTGLCRVILRFLNVPEGHS